MACVIRHLNKQPSLPYEWELAPKARSTADNHGCRQEWLPVGKISLKNSS